MKLPNGNRAVVDIAKLVDYCLNPQHSRGRHKARVFAAAGIDRPAAERLRSALLAAASGAEAQAGASDAYGQRYIVDFEMTGSERAVRIRSIWMIRSGEELPRLSTCYVL